MPTVYAPPCVPVISGHTNSGATWGGVSGSTIDLVYYQPQPGGLSSAIAGAAGTPATNFASAQAYVAMFNHVYNTYGRHVNLILLNATGSGSDPVAAHADAVTAAQQLHAFVSIGGPAATSAYEEELARLHVLCMGCGDSSLTARSSATPPTSGPISPTADTSLDEAIDYLVAKLNGKDATWAGEASLRFASADVHRGQRNV